MLIDFKSHGKYIVVIGGGLESYRKTKDFLEAGAKVLVISRSFSPGIRKLNEQGKIELQQKRIEDVKSLVSSLKPKPNLIVAVTNSHVLNAQLVEYAKQAGYIVYAPDNPAISDFILPAIAKVGDVRIAVTTGGKSPAMASVIRRRIEKMITAEDLLQIKLQDHIRSIIKKAILDQKTRKQILYNIIQNEPIRELLSRGKFEEAKKLAEKIVTQQNKEKSMELPS